MSVIAALVLLVAPIRANACPVPSGADPSLANVAPELRLSYLRDRLAGEAHRANFWTYAWIAANAALVAGTAGALLFYPKNERIDIYVGIPATTIAALPLILLRPDIERDGLAFERATTLATPADTCRLVADGERLFAHNAADELGQMQWLPQLINAGYNIAVGLVLGLAFNRWTTGGTAMFSGFTIGEMVMYTQPRDLPDQWNAYLSGSFSKPPAAPSFAFAASPNGVTFRMAF